MDIKMTQQCISLWIFCMTKVAGKYTKYFMKSAHAFCCDLSFGYVFNTLRPRQNGRHFPDDIFKWIFLNENVWILINISLKFVPRGPINNIPTLVQVMAWRRPGDKPLSEPMMFRLPTHICVTRPQWVNPGNLMGLTHQGQVTHMIRSPLFQIMALRLFGDEQLTKPVLPYCQLDQWEST